MNDIINLLSGLLTPVIAITVTYIAYKQYQLAKIKTKNELYERRLPIFKSVMEFLSKIIINGNAERDVLFRLLQETSENRFLFNKEIDSYIDELYKKGVSLRQSNNMIKKYRKKSDKDKEYEEACNKEEELLLWFSEQFKIAERLFSKYLLIELK